MHFKEIFQTMGPARKELVSTKEDNAVQCLLGLSSSFIFNIPQHTSSQAVIQPQEKYVGEAWSNSMIDTTLVRYLKVSTLWAISRYPQQPLRVFNVWTHPIPQSPMAAGAGALTY